MSDRKKLILLSAFIAAVVLFSFIYICSVGSHFELHTSTFLADDNLSEYEVKFDDDGIVKFSGAHLENNEIVIELDALKQGSTDFYFTFGLNGDDNIQIERSLTVTNLNILISEDTGTITFNGYLVTVYAFVAILFAAVLVMLWIFVDHYKKGEFSYGMVASGGIGIYCSVLFLYLIYKLLNNFVSSFSYVATLIDDAASVLIAGLSPVMLILSIMLAVSNIWLIRHEGRRPVNTLGIVFAFVWLIGMMLTLEANYFTFLWKFSYYAVVSRVLFYIVAYFECMFISTAAATVLSTKFIPPYDRDYIIILGCAIRNDGSLTPLLKGRVDSAVAFEQKQFEKTGKHAIFVPSGGQGSDEVISEGEAMENYLIGIGIPKEQILREDKSVNTMQNMQFSKGVIEKHCGDVKNAKIAFSTTNYHVFRGYILSKKLGFKAIGISAKTKPYFYLNAFLREFIGLLVDQKWKHILFILIIILTYLLVFILNNLI